MRKYLVFFWAILLLSVSCSLGTTEPQTGPEEAGKPEMVFEDNIKLSVPENDAVIELAYGRQEKIPFQWLTDEYGVACKLLISDNVSMTDSVEVDCGSVPRYMMPHEKMDEILAGFGIPDYKRATLYWTVTYSVGRFTFISAPNRLVLYRMCKPFKDPRDNQEYEVCRIIDGQTGQYSIWMAENLRAKTYSDGTPLPEGSYGFYSEDKKLTEIFGAYYTWDAVVGNSEADPETGNIQGVAPDGWHIPSSSEWNFLRVAADKGAGAAKELMNPDYWDPDSGNVGVNSFGFNAVASGYVYKMPLSVVSDVGGSTYFWTSTLPKTGESYGGVWITDPSQVEGTALSCGITKNRPALPIYFYAKNRGMSVRCVLD